MNINDALYTDIAHNGDLIPTNSGDLATVSGLDNLKLALFHRLMTVPGSLVHQPTYGVGIPLHQNNLGSFGTQQQLASIIQEQFAQDPRVASVSSVMVSTDSDPQLTKIRVFMTPNGYDELAMNFTPFSGGI